MKREKGMPKLNASWKTIHPPVAHFSFKSGSLPVHLKSCETELPWGIKGGFKAKRIPSNTTHEFILRFRELQPCDCQVSLALEVEELGSWTQYLRLVNPEVISENEKRSVEINNVKGRLVSMMNLDDTDNALLAARLKTLESVTALARKVGIAQGTVLNRIRRMKTWGSSKDTVWSWTLHRWVGA